MIDSENLRWTVHDSCSHDSTSIVCIKVEVRLPSICFYVVKIDGIKCWKLTYHTVRILEHSQNGSSKMDHVKHYEQKVAPLVQNNLVRQIIGIAYEDLNEKPG